MTNTPLIRCMCGRGITLTLKMWGVPGTGSSPGLSQVVDYACQVLGAHPLVSVAVGVDGSGLWRAPTAVRAYWWRMGIR